MEQGVIPKERMADAIALLFGLQPQGEALAAQAFQRLVEQPSQAEGLLGFWDDQQVLAAIWVVLDHESTATVGTPVIHPHASVMHPEWPSKLLNWANEWQASQGVTWSQALLSIEDSQAWGSAFHEVGYQQPAKLEYLHVDLGHSRPDRPQALGAPQTQSELPSGWAWQPATDMTEAAMLNLVEATFIDTLDCPFLGQHRTMTQIVDGFKKTGDSWMDHWNILTRAGEYVGCLLGSLHRDAALMEWTYVGLVPEIRGQGRGHWLCQRGLQDARQAGCRTVAVAVDNNNLPAQQLYGRHGFQTWDYRNVFVKWNWDQTRSSFPT